MHSKQFPLGMVWLRRDLRLDDHAALALALAQCERVLWVFIFDSGILNGLTDKHDRRVEFFHGALAEIDAQLRSAGSALLTRQGCPVDEIPRLANEFSVNAVYAARDHEPTARQRDQAVQARLEAHGKRWVLVQDQTLFERDELLTASGNPYTVFTPYKNAWLKKAAPERFASFDTGAWRQQAYPVARPQSLPTLNEIGFEITDLAHLKMPVGASGAQKLFADFQPRIDRYGTGRDFPAKKGVSYLSAHLRFGTLSIRQLARYAWTTIHTEPMAAEGAKVWLSELIWRDFYFQILFHFPHVTHSAFKPAFDGVIWEENEEDFEAWCKGETGYPMVDAGMRQLNQTGWMHNRLRMITAAFLTKDLGIDWRRGEAYFAQKLLDFDLAANNGGWQWSASTGCDAQPWFRIFNPVTQSEKFDPEGRFIRKYVPEIAHLPDKAIHAPWQSGGVPGYPAPRVDHTEARARTLARFNAIKLAADNG